MLELLSWPFTRRHETYQFKELRFPPCTVNARLILMNLAYGGFDFYSSNAFSTLHPFNRLLQHTQYSLLSTPFIRFMHIHPPRRQRQTHQDTLHPRTRRIQAKTSPTVMYEIELDIPSPPQLLPLFFPVPKRHVFPPRDNGQVTRQERP